MSLKSHPRLARPSRFLWVAAVLALSTQARSAQFEVVASGLDNPRGLDFAPNGALYIAEAGRGGTVPATFNSPEGAPLYFGLTGAITRVFKGKQERLVTGLPSLAAQGGGAAIGPSTVSFGNQGNALVTIGLGSNPANRTKVGPQGASLATLQQLNPSGHMKFVADLGAFEAANNPDGGAPNNNPPDTNPNGAINLPGVAYLADAGANALLSVASNGAISVVAVFSNRPVPNPFAPPQAPPIPMQAVPTNVVRGPDGALYVSQLTGFPFPPGGANIYRVVPGSAPAVYKSGFTNIIDLEFDSLGRLYVLEIDTNGLLTAPPQGRLARVNLNGTVDTIASAGLVMPGGMAIGPDGAIYVSNLSVAPGGGEVVRIQP